MVVICKINFGFVPEYATVSRLCSVVNNVRGCDYRSDIHCMQHRVMCGYVLEQVHNHTLSAAEDNAWLAN